MRRSVVCLLGSILVGITASSSASAQAYFDDGYGGGYGPVPSRGYYGVERRYEREPTHRDRYIEYGPRGRVKRVTRSADPYTGRTYVRAVERGPYGPIIREEFIRPDGSKVTRRTFPGPNGERKVVVDRY
jgi:hypothetical protein